MLHGYFASTLHVYTSAFLKYKTLTIFNIQDIWTGMVPELTFFPYLIPVLFFVAGLFLCVLTVLLS